MKAASILLIVVVFIAGIAVYISSLPPPYNPEIRNWRDLDAIRYYLDRSFVLMNNLDATTAGYGRVASHAAHEGRGWVPIGTPDNPFAGSFDGQGYEISGMLINRPGAGSVGLFGVIDERGFIQNVEVVNIAVITTLPAGSESYFLLGANPVAIGGLAGENRGTIKYSHASGVVAGYWLVGGLVGENSGTVSNCYFNGSVTDNLGHLPGATGNGTGSGPQVDCADSTVPCDITLVAPEVGALCMATKNVGFSWNLPEDADVFNWVLSPSCDLTNPIDTKSGLTGRAYACTRTLAYDTQYYWQVTAMKGGAEICRSPLGTFRTCPPSDVITRSGRIGGLVGYNRGTISTSYFNGNVTGSDGVGGLAGRNQGTITGSYSAASVTGDCGVGGLVGSGEGDVSDCYFAGHVTGSFAVGGLTGRMSSGTTSNSYSAGDVSGCANTGGLVGFSTNEGVVRHDFWDVSASGQCTSAGGRGKTTAEMKSAATFFSAGWNIIAVTNPGTRNPAYIWNIVNGVSYPFLSWQPVS